jgi:hypothetical protein
MKTYGGVKVQLHLSITVYQLDRRLGGSHSRSGSCGKEKISWPFRESNPDSSAFQPIARLYAGSPERKIENKD